LRLANFINYFSIDDLDVEALDRRLYGRSRVCCVSDPAREGPFNAYSYSWVASLTGHPLDKMVRYWTELPRSTTANRHPNREA